MAKEKKKLKILTKSELRKKYQGSDLASIVIPSKDEMLWLPSDILTLNAFLGGGIPYGKAFSELGYESTGKSLLAMAFARTTQSLGGIVLWGDLENSWANYWAEQNGLDTTKVEVYTSNAIEPFSDWVRDYCIYYRSILTHNEPILLVIDSIAMAETKNNVDADQDDAKAAMGNRAKAIGDFYRKRSNMFHNYGICVIPINQLREKLGAGMFESNETAPGGKATQFFASQAVVLARGKQIKAKINGKEKRVGQNVYIQFRKNKVAAPQENIATQVYFREENEFGYVGFNKYMGLLDYLLEEGIVKKKGTGIYRKDKLIARGEDHFVRVMHENDELRSLLVRKSSINTVGKTRKKLESITTNLFPVKIKNDE